MFTNKFNMNEEANTEVKTVDSSAIEDTLRYVLHTLETCPKGATYSGYRINVDDLTYDTMISKLKDALTLLERVED